MYQLWAAAWSCLPAPLTPICCCASVLASGAPGCLWLCLSLVVSRELQSSPSSPLRCPVCKILRKPGIPGYPLDGGFRIQDTVKWASFKECLCQMAANEEQDPSLCIFFYTVYEHRWENDWWLNDWFYDKCTLVAIYLEAGCYDFTNMTFKNEVRVGAVWSLSSRPLWTINHYDNVSENMPHLSVCCLLALNEAYPDSYAKLFLF